jgi:hypothetical protein
MEQLDLRHLWYLSGTARAPDLAQALGVDGLFGEYGVTPQPRQELLGDTVAVWADTNPWEKPYDRVETYVERIRARIPAERPAFLMVGVNGFHIGPNEVAAVLRELGPDVVAVAPAELCELVRRFRTAGLDPNPVPRPALGLTPPPVRAPGLHREGDAWVLRESEGEPDVSGWWTAPQGTPWVRTRLDLSLPAGVTTATVRAFVQGKAGRRVGFRINGHEHSVTLRSSHWGWVSVTVPVAELVSGPNEVWYSGNPDGRLLIGGHSGSGPGHSDFGGPTTWHPLAGELACVLELR